MKWFSLLTIPTLLTVAGVLSGCGSDDDNDSGPRDYSGLDIKTLTYDGLETDAVISSTNYLAIATAAHQTALAEMNNDLIGNMTPSVAIDNRQITGFSVQTMHDQLISHLIAAQNVQPQAIAKRKPDSITETTEDAVGTCGGKARVRIREEYESEVEDETNQHDLISRSTERETSVVMDNYCEYFLNEDSEYIPVTTSGRIVLDYNSHNSEPDEYTKVYRLSSELTADMVMNAYTRQYRIKSRKTEERNETETEDTNNFTYTFDPETYLNEITHSYAILTPAGAGFYTRTETTLLDTDNTELPETQTELLEIDGQVVKYDGYARDRSGVELKIYIPAYGLVSVDTDSSVAMCEDGSGIQSGTINIDAGETYAAAEITVTYTSCNEASVTYVAGPATEVMEQ